MENNLTKIKKLEKQLTAAVFLLFILITGFLVVYDSGSKEALAITGNYSKDANAGLTAADWNKLDDDFVAENGDATLGNLNLTGLLTGGGASGMKIKNTGEVGINTNAPLYKLTVKDNAGGPDIYIWGDGANPELALGGNSSDSYWSVYGDEMYSKDLRFWRKNSSTDKGNKMVITDDGMVGIGTDAPQSKLDVSGLVKAKELEVNGDLKVSNNTWDGGSCAEIHWSGTNSGRSVECPNGKYMTKVRFARDSDNEFWATCCGL